MAEFDLNVMTPEHEFYSGKAEALTVNTTDGSVTILANHMPMVTDIEVGEMSMKRDGEWKTAVTARGFMEVSPTGVDVFVMSCEYPENIDDIVPLCASTMFLAKASPMPVPYLLL